MPIYEAVCLTCGKYHDYICHSSKCYETPICCGEKTDKRILTPPVGTMDIAPWDAYRSPATGKTITSKAERREDMKTAGCRDWEGMESEKRIAARATHYKDKELDDKIDTTVRKAWANLSPQQKASALQL